MATLNIENAKKFGDLTPILEYPDTALLLIHDGNGVKTITAEDFLADVNGLIIAAQNTIDAIATVGAGAHNAIYRGKSFGGSVTAEQWAAITAGTFEDLYIGDYWTINGIDWRIAAFDYYLHTGDTECVKHHVTLVPDAHLYKGQMNTSNVTTGGYVSSAMYTTGLASAKSTITGAFGSSHVLNHRQLLSNATANGEASGWSWYDSTVELMNEVNVYGTNAWGGAKYNMGIDKSQFPLFAFRPDLLTTRESWWLRDVTSASYFAYVGSDGRASDAAASASCGVRPAFSIC